MATTTLSTSSTKTKVSEIKVTRSTSPSVVDASKLDISSGVLPPISSKLTKSVTFNQNVSTLSSDSDNAIVTTAAGGVDAVNTPSPALNTRLTSSTISEVSSPVTSLIKKIEEKEHTSNTDSKIDHPSSSERKNLSSASASTKNGNSSKDSKNTSSYENVSSSESDSCSDDSSSSSEEEEVEKDYFSIINSTLPPPPQLPKQNKGNNSSKAKEKSIDFKRTKMN